MSDSSTYVFKYFDARGVAETIRVLFYVAGVKYEDIRLSLNTTTWARPEFDEELVSTSPIDL